MFTPGPWAVENITTTELKDVDTIVAPPKPGCKTPLRVVAPGEIYGRSLEEAIDNARLIAAAPDLLAALVGLADCAGITALDGYKGELDEAMRTARSAIAKATGVQNV